MRYIDVNHAHDALMLSLSWMARGTPAGERIEPLVAGVLATQPGTDEYAAAVTELERRVVAERGALVQTLGATWYDRLTEAAEIEIRGLPLRRQHDVHARERIISTSPYARSPLPGTRLWRSTWGCITCRNGATWEPATSGSGNTSCQMLTILAAPRRLRASAVGGLPRTLAPGIRAENARRVRLLSASSRSRATIRRGRDLPGDNGSRIDPSKPADGDRDWALERPASTLPDRPRRPHLSLQPLHHQ